MERHRRALELARCVYRGEDLRLTISAGVVSVNQEFDDSAAALQAALRAQAKAAASGGNRVHLDTPTTTFDATTEVLPPISELVDRERLVLRCQKVQPLTGTETKRKPYYEVLLGIQDTQGTVLPPGALVHAAELRGEIQELDRWVVETTLHWMADHRRLLTKLGGLAINISGPSISDPNMLSFVHDALSKNSHSPGEDHPRSHRNRRDQRLAHRPQLRVGPKGARLSILLG